MHIIHNGKTVAQIVMGRLCKYNLNESKHLLWKYGGVPAINAAVWDEYKGKVKEIYIRTQKGRRFRCGADIFEAKKKEFTSPGYEKQYYVDKDWWDISDARYDSESEEQGKQMPLLSEENPVPQTADEVWDAIVAAAKDDGLDKKT